MRKNSYSLVIHEERLYAYDGNIVSSKDLPFDRDDPLQAGHPALNVVLPQSALALLCRLVLRLCPVIEVLFLVVVVRQISMTRSSP